MRRKSPIAHQLYNHLYPHPGPNDPASFSAHLARNLVPEVRIEVAIFYGNLNSTEARYPGLDYCHAPHRMRLGRFKHHHRLFKAFDALGLTNNEIQDFCCWEGTRWARERFEKDERVTVHDTTGDEIGPYVDRRELHTANDETGRQNTIHRKTEITVSVEEASNTSPSPPPAATDEEMSEAQGHDHQGDGRDTPRPHEGTSFLRPTEDSTGRVEMHGYIRTARPQGQSNLADLDKEANEHTSAFMPTGIAGTVPERTIGLPRAAA